MTDGPRDALIEFAEREFEYLRAQNGRDFFLALAPYVNALHGRPRIREILEALEAEAREAMERFVHEQNGLTDEAKAIRAELAERAPEIDNSDMEEPDHASHARARYDLDSFANFDRIADADHRVGYAAVPRDDDDPGPVPRLLVILRGRLRAAEFGEDSGINSERIRDDLIDLNRRLVNLDERHRASRQRYRQESRTLPGMAHVRLIYFGSDLVPEPVQIETEEDFERFLDRSLREWGQPKATVQKFVNGERLEDWEERLVSEIETMLKGEVARLHRELERRLTVEAPQAEAASARDRRSLRVPMFIREHSAEFIVGILVLVVGTLIAAPIVYYGFGIGRDHGNSKRRESSPPSSSPGVTVATSSTTSTTTRPSTERSRPAAPQGSSQDGGDVSISSSQEFFEGALVVSLGEIDASGPELIATRLIVRAEGAISCRYARVSVGDVIRVRARGRIYIVEVRGIEIDYVELAVFRNRPSGSKKLTDCFA